ncbi:MAG: hypothetical protein CMH53_01520 [Myxococcales bacterium]|nr:hypothetical protein [Myxococcales bacterium]
MSNSRLVARACLSLSALAAVDLRPEEAEKWVNDAEHATVQSNESPVFTGSLSGLSGHELQDQLARSAVVLEASVAMERARHSARAGRWSAARLALDTAADAARKVEAWSLYLELLRLDAAIARQRGDPRSAVQALGNAIELAQRLSIPKMVALLSSECVLALADNEQWQEAFTLQSNEPEALLMAQPAIHAGRLDAFAVLSLHAGDFVAAERAVSESRRIKLAAGDRLGALRSSLLLAEARRRSGDLQATVEVIAAIEDDLAKCGRADIVLTAQLISLQVRRQGLVEPLSWRDEALGAVSLADEAGSISQQITARDLVSTAFQLTLEIADARRWADEAVELADAQPLLRWRARTRCRLSTTLLAANEPQMALAQANEAMQLSEQADDTVARARSLSAASLALVELGRLDEAQLASGQAVADALAVQQSSLASEAALTQAESFLRMQRLREALHAFQQAEAYALRAGSTAMQTRAMRGAAAALIAAGDGQRAREILSRAEAISNGEHARLCIVDLARIETFAAQPSQALTRLDSLDDQQLSPLVTGELTLVRAQALTILGKSKQALSEARKAVEVLRPLGGRSLGAALYTQGQLEVACGDPAAAGERLAEALTLTGRLGLAEQHRVRETLEKLEAKANSA